MTEMSITSAREMPSDLRTLRPWVYWMDLLLSAGVGWVAFSIAVTRTLYSPAMLAATAIATLLLYRALCFVHEISHNGSHLPWFEWAWNLLVGFPFFLPSFMYSGVHLDHHKARTYGTDKDPEYLPFARSAALTTRFLVLGFFAPLLVCVRFLVLAPLGLVSNRLQRWLIERASALAINPKYRRSITPRLVWVVRRDSILLNCEWAVALGLIASHVIPPRVLLIWFIVSFLVNFVNNTRTLCAHAYESAGTPMDRRDQLADSIDIPGQIWTELWAPLGLRYHAMHHYRPSIPYHALPSAYRRLADEAQLATTYPAVRSRGLCHSIWTLYAKGLRDCPNCS